MTNKTTEFFAETGESIERDATPEEIAVINAMHVQREQIEADEAAKVVAKQALLERLGITQTEAKLLGL